ncbi:MAG: hypothetical protein RJA35_1289 [Actinomycetota bacterium]
MADLRLESTDGEYLVLESPDGTTFRLLIDEALRKAVRRETVSANDSNLISPRDIQLEVRSGVTIEELAQKTGASLEYIEKFAAPVIDELAHVVSSALSVRITMAGDRYNETTQVEFGEVVANRLATNGIVQHSWAARKSDNHGWQLHCSYGDNRATWAFDPRKLLLSPENELAIQLSTQQSLTDGPIPRLRPVLDVAAQSTPSAPASNEPVASGPVASEPVSSKPDAAFEPTFAQPVPPVSPISVVRAVEDIDAADEVVEEFDLSATVAIEMVTESASANQTRDLGETADFEGVVPFGRVTTQPETPDAASAPVDLTNTADLLDALRKRRIERERDAHAATTGSISIVPEPAADFSESLDDAPVNDFSFEPEAASVADEPEYDNFDSFDEPVDEPVDESFAEDSSDSETGSVTTETTPIDVVEEKPKKPGRSSMPSWDEIVFNTRHDED